MVDNISIQPTSHYGNIPKGWTIASLADVAKLVSGRDLQPQQYNSTGKGIPYITGASNVDNGNLIVNRWTEEAVTVSSIGDLLITCKGTIGKLAFNTIGDIHIARQIMALTIGDTVNPQYVFYCLLERIDSIKQRDNGLIPGIERSVILNQKFPIPPLAEQERIVGKIKMIFSVLDSIITSVQ